MPQNGTVMSTIGGRVAWRSEFIRNLIAIKENQFHSMIVLLNGVAIAKGTMNSGVWLRLMDGNFLVSSFFFTFHNGDILESLCWCFFVEN